MLNLIFLCVVSGGLAFLVYRTLVGKHVARVAITLDPPLGEAPSDPEWLRRCEELRALGFSVAGDFQVALGPTPEEPSYCVLRAWLAPDARSYCVLYDIAQINAGIGTHLVWLDFVSELDAARSLTTCNAAPNYFAANPNRPTFRHAPGTHTARLLELHTAHVARFGESAPARALTAGEFTAVFERAWRESFEFQASKQLVIRSGPIWQNSPAMARRAIVSLFLPVFDRGWPRFFAGVAVLGLLLVGGARAYELALAGPLSPALNTILRSEYTPLAIAFAGGVIGRALLGYRAAFWCLGFGIPLSLIAPGFAVPILTLVGNAASDVVGGLRTKARTEAVEAAINQRTA